MRSCLPGLPSGEMKRSGIAGAVIAIAIAGCNTDKRTDEAPAAASSDGRTTAARAGGQPTAAKPYQPATRVPS